MAEGDRVIVFCLQSELTALQRLFFPQKGGEYGVNFGLAARFLGNLLLVEAALLTIPLGISFHFGEQRAVLAFLLAMGLLGVVGFALSNIRAASRRIKRGRH